MIRTIPWIGAIGLVLAVYGTSLAAEVLLPQQRTAYYASEGFELAVVGLDKGAKAEVQLVPQAAGLSPVTFSAAGDGSTVNVKIPAGALAPATYAVHLDGKATGAAVTIASGVNDSSMLVSQTDRVENIRKGEGNFIVGNVAGFGVIGRDGMPSKSPRARTMILNTYDRATASNLPTLVYMYWTGYVTHKPWGTRKSWAEATMQETMRLFSLHVGQRMRRYKRNICAIGTIDEPGLNYGRTPAGGWASGFANWDTQPWYQARGWKFTNDPARRSDADWMKYMTLRCGIIGASQVQARKDLQVAWPDVAFETDVYAVHVVTDGADAMNQQANGDTPTTHVFLDWGIGRDCAVTEIYIEKANNPAANVAHAMNGRLMGGKVPQAPHQICYHVMMNSMLAAGLKSNWWLNWGEMGIENVAAVNEPAKRYGPVVSAMKPGAHDVAVLWSFTELCMREKAFVAKTARQKGGEQIKMMISALPENTAVKDKELVLSAYTIAGNYRNQISHCHNALLRAGYPAHVVHERVLPGLLKNYKTLVIIGQTFALPAEVNKAIADFVGAGGKLVVDKTTTVPFDGAVVTEADFKDPAFKWGAMYGEAVKKDHAFKSDREASYFLTNVFMDAPIRKAVAPMKAAMAETPSRQFVAADSTDLIIERHVGGEGAVYMVLNTHQELPKIAEDEKYLIWNYAPYKTSFTLKGIADGSAVYAIEGIDWKKVSKLADVRKPIRGDFAAGEMKLYLAAPREPEGLRASAKVDGSSIAVSAALTNLKMPWPITVTVTGPDGKELYKVHRSTDAAGQYAEVYPIGVNAKAGAYAVKVASPVANLAAEAKVDSKPGAGKPTVIAGKVRVFDPEAIRKFLAAKPAITIAVGTDEHKPAGAALAKALGGKGIRAKVVHEKQLIRRVRYPRVVNPYIKVYKNQGEEKKPAGKVDYEVKLQILDDGRIVAHTPDGEELGAQRKWRRPKTLATVVGKGFIDFYSPDGEECFEPGCKIYINDKGQRVVLKGVRTELKATQAARRKWTRPWHRLRPYNGAWNLSPQLPEAYAVDQNLILLGDSTTGELTAALQASELLLQVVDAKYPGPGKSLISFAWSPFALGKNVILVGAADAAGLAAGIDKLVGMTR